MQLEDINFQIGSVNPSGISDEVYYTPKQYIDEWPTIQNDFENAATPAAYANYQGNFKMKANKVWNRLYTTQGKGKISWEYIGETDCKMVSNKASLSYPKLTDEIRAFAKYASNGDFVFLVKHDGKFYVIGSPDYPATPTPKRHRRAPPRTAPPTRQTATAATLPAAQRASPSTSNAPTSLRCPSTPAPSRCPTARSTARQVSSNLDALATTPLPTTATATPVATCLLMTTAPTKRATL